MWQDFLVSDRENAARQLRERYVRINPRLSIDPSHGTNAMKHFDRIQRQTQSYLDTQLTVIDRIVMNLVASLFFFTASTLPVPTGEGSGYKITGKVVCRLRERKDYIRALGTFLVQRQRSGVKLSLEVRECTCGESGNTIQKIELEETVERMISGRDPYVIIRNLAVSTKNAQVDMSLLLTSPGKPLNRYSLSRFPRRIMLDDSELRINGTAETEDSTLADLTDAEDELSQQTSYIATSSDSESVPVHEPLADMSLLLRHTGAVFPSLLSLVPSMIE
ncbi:hypothetical protein EJ06DRAFT_65603 [Trichodelitschia bisporula]|uniref:Uncharacterized protein n=1 Tax=Trichodelitschia bisporula TaxID=703511 RepID=A0A6G1HSX2_9PEZI|nr:hypothetical protein EJ06DRAFT_65603 [Trichodelitschia bisporula]